MVFLLHDINDIFLEVRYSAATPPLLCTKPRASTTHAAPVARRATRDWLASGFPTCTTWSQSRLLQAPIYLYWF